jgi:asparagine synthase (glutamine-hydrolysing)
MCGLVALLGLEGHEPDAPQLERMVDSIRHRGPDDSGTLVDGPLALGFRRLSILDLSPAGHQPMIDREAQVSLIFNGEIYNYLELRAELQALGHRFGSTGDSEVLLRAYLQWGRDCVTRFNGMWAFVIADHRRRLLFGSRDRFGVKPLYRCRNASTMAFASEIKALLAGGIARAEADLATAANFLVDNRLDDTDATFYAGVQAVPAAHCFEADTSGQYRQWRYWSLEPGRDVPARPAEAFAELFEDAMRLHMRSDVPVAVHLSGGLDSTAIACASARVRERTAAVGALSAFCYLDPKYDERAYIDATLEQTGARMTPLSCTPRQLWDCLPDALRAHDEPMHSLTPLVGYQLMKLTAQHGIKVVLNGQGADETLAGYGSYFTAYWQSLLRRGALGLLTAEVRDWARANGRAPLAELAGVGNRAVREALRRVPAYRALSRQRWRDELVEHAWIEPAMRERATPHPFDDPELMPTLMRSVERDPLPTYLRVEDRNSSAFSIEGRVPFLDYRLVELAFALPPEWHMRGAQNKYVLREAMRGRMPEPVRARIDKMGFPTSASSWLRGELREPVSDLVNDASFRRCDGIDADCVAALLDRHQRGEADHAAPVIRAVQWFLWRRDVLGGPNRPAGGATYATSPR